MQPILEDFGLFTLALMSAINSGCVKTRQVGELAQQSDPRDAEFTLLVLRTESP